MPSSYSFTWGLVCSTHSVSLCPAPRVEALSDDARLTSDVCLSRTSGLSLEQRGLGRLKLCIEVAHVTRLGHHFQDKKSQRSTCRGQGILWWPPAKLVFPWLAWVSPALSDVSPGKRFRILFVQTFLQADVCLTPNHCCPSVEFTKIIIEFNNLSKKTVSFLPRDAMRKRSLCCRPVPVRPSIRPSGWSPT